MLKFYRVEMPEISKTCVIAAEGSDCAYYAVFDYLSALGLLVKFRILTVFVYDSRPHQITSSNISDFFFPEEIDLQEAIMFPSKEFEEEMKKHTIMPIMFYGPKRNPPGDGTNPAGGS